MKLYTYLMTCDDGFAPNPFFGYCTLACCKPAIRRTARPGDWIIGIRGKELYKRTHEKLSTDKSEVFKIIYAMCVHETLTFKEYWNDGRFNAKKPDIDALDKRCAGDNVYKPLKTTGNFKLLKNLNGHTKTNNLKHDLSGKNVLVSAKNDFYYFGKKALPIPEHLQKKLVKCYANWGQNGQGHLCEFEKIVIDEIINHIQKRKSGRHADPSQWENMQLKTTPSCTPNIRKIKKRC